MKALAISFLAFTSISSFAQSNVEVYSFLQVGEKIEQLNEFTASSFYSEDTKYCYTGDVNLVCSKVKDAEGIQMGRYHVEGAHDFFTVTSCTVENNAVSAVLRLQDDYGTDESVVAQVGKCE